VLQDRQLTWQASSHLLCKMSRDVEAMLEKEVSVILAGDVPLTP
jgi:hypothetical protein